MSFWDNVVYTVNDSKFSSVYYSNNTNMDLELVEQ
jgi:hypothetical protein